MDRRLFPLAQFVAFAGILAGGYAIVASARATAVATATREQREQQETTGQQTAPQAALPAQIAARTATSISAARPPVPLLLSPRPPREEAAASWPAEATPDSAVTGQTDKKVSSDAAAKAMIEADGYKNVRAVAKASDGSWRGLAMRGAVEVAVSVDDNGNVSTQ